MVGKGKGKELIRRRREYEIFSVSGKWEAWENSYFQIRTRGWW